MAQPLRFQQKIQTILVETRERLEQRKLLILNEDDSELVSQSLK
jgi:hypothetical protein